ncbi:hypothetical protein J2W22_004624 [Sphingomonas kyeonggiensis]|uniref:hypothetical protein n=1 Tax=Sphingomonas kyeonggiensis TaxID=1268553 RepID=UPI0027825176|nr:hypothetical protein [Sphingomonas kyeonggiensis]MDQ0252536.1 hypothetical protein [Sphingomonas kyeonggiensis]
MPARRKMLFVLGAVAVAVIAALIAWPATPPAPEAGAVVVRPTAPAASPSPAPVPEPSASASPTRSPIETSILASIGDSRAELRDVVARRDAPQIACGEKRTARDPVFRRFVWLGHLKMLATDDGSADFGNIAAVCREGQPVP